ncbi:LCP family protein [Microbacterium phyllosphaerae]|uniref:LCP family protein n=1 Tax=Microbacterium phyllosphaerae TaxID=124798 RepID=UPI00216A614E|nr:LCP family protein [Microbacterium phyllosphaerae]MCS3443018.1 LCP family protein required for cell wall assembly [Microbacterium phyllosphaerae]
MIGWISALVVVALIAVGAIAYAQLQGNVTTAPLRSDPSSEPLATGDLNILLLGSDTRALASGGYGDDDGSQRSDAMVVAHISSDNTRIDAVQLPRDTLTDLPACEDTGRGSFDGGFGMLNSALEYGPACSVAAVEQLTGLTIDHFVQIDFEGFIGIVDAMGGIDVCLPQALTDGHAQLDLPAGAQSIDGTQALALARTRHALAEESDVARLGHQQMVLSAIVQKATKTDVLVRPDRLYAFLDAATSSMTVDPGLGALTDLAGLAARVANVPMSSVTFLTMPTTEAPQDRNRVVPTADADVIFRALLDDVPVVLTTDEVEEDATVRTAPVRILNGAGVAGLASRVSEDATGYGYTVSGLANADAADLTVITAADTPDAQQTAQALASELGLAVTVQTGDVEGVQLLLGADYTELTSQPRATPPPSRPVDAVNRSADTDLCTA